MEADKCSVSGYVVGYQQELPVKLAVNGYMYMDNIPLVITGDRRKN